MLFHCLKKKKKIKGKKRKEKLELNVGLKLKNKIKSLKKKKIEGFMQTALSMTIFLWEWEMGPTAKVNK